MDITHERKKAQKWLYFLRKLKTGVCRVKFFFNFHRGAIESILTGKITNCRFVQGPGQECSAAGD